MTLSVFVHGSKSLTTGCVKLFDQITYLIPFMLNQNKA